MVMMFVTRAMAMTMTMRVNVEKKRNSGGELGDRNGGGDLHEDSRALALPRSTLRSGAFRSSDPESWKSVSVVIH